MDPVSVLAGVLARDGSELSATETLQQELSRADHLGVLGAIWDDLTRRAQAARFEQALRDALPADLAEQALDDPACTWLWRTLREAEAAGLDGSEILRQAVTDKEHDRGTRRSPSPRLPGSAACSKACNHSPRAAGPTGCPTWARPN